MDLQFELSKIIVEHPTMERDDCPVQDSFNNILHSLNDDCIQEVLRRLSNVKDFLSAAKVCIRFQENAVRCLPFKSISIRDGEPFSDSIPVQRLESFLSVFGRLIKTIRWNTTNRDLDAHIFNTIAVFCAKSLLELIIIDHKIDFNAGIQFEALEKLEIETSLIDNFKIHPKLKVLKLKLVKVLHFDSFYQTNSKLCEIDLVNVHGFTDELLMEFLRRNPQLKRFKLEGCKRISSAVLRNIGQSVPDLINLHVMFFSSFFEPVDMLHIGELRKLLCLEINCPKFAANSLFDRLVENEVHLEELTINGYVNDFADRILQLNSLKKLNVGYLSEEIFLIFVKELQYLERIRIECNDITVHGIKKALKYGRRLTQLTIVIGCQMTIDLNTYNSLLTMARDRTRVMLMIRTEKYKIKRNDFYSNRQWVNVCYL